MKRTLIGCLFLLHGLAHSGLGIWASGSGPASIVTPLWLAAQVGFIVAGLGILGVPWCRRFWEPTAVIAAFASIVLFDVFGTRALLAGFVLDAVLLVLGLRWGESAVVAKMRDTDVPLVPPRHPIINVIASVVVMYVATVIVLRPWMITWGTTPADRAQTLPGDDRVFVANYRMDHAVTIKAPADSVWPWLAQIGQDRAGFYSYDRLERLFGAQIHNAEAVHPEWQVRQAGELVRATQPDYMNGRFGRELGWRVREVIPGEAIVLEGWGAFVVRPIDARTSRLHIRLRGDGTPTVVTSLLAPVTLLAFEPAHFIMERRMLLGIRERAERGSVRAAARAGG